MTALHPAEAPSPEKLIGLRKSGQELQWGTDAVTFTISDALHFQWNSWLTQSTNAGTFTVPDPPCSRYLHMSSSTGYDIESCDTTSVATTSASRTLGWETCGNHVNCCNGAPTQSPSLSLMPFTSSGTPGLHGAPAQAPSLSLTLLAADTCTCQARRDMTSKVATPHQWLPRQRPHSGLVLMCSQILPLLHQQGGHQTMAWQIVLGNFVREQYSQHNRQCSHQRSHRHSRQHSRLSYQRSHQRSHQLSQGRSTVKSTLHVSGIWAAPHPAEATSPKTQGPAATWDTNVGTFTVSDALAANTCTFYPSVGSPQSFHGPPPSSKDLQIG